MPINQKHKVKSTVYKIQTELQDVLNEVYTLSIISSILVPHHESLTS